MPIDQLQGRRNDAGLGDCSRRLAGGDDRVEIADDGSRGSWQRLEAYGRFGDDAERSFRTNHQPHQVVTSNSFGGDPAEPYQLAGAGHYLEGQHIILGYAVLDAAHAAGICRDIPANGRPRRACWIGRIPEALLGGGGAQLVIDHSGLNHGQPLERIDQADLVESVERDDHAAVNGVGAAR